ncbi:TPA: hypothetical protein QCZ04_003473 [Bacillus cereus]|nr:hypothetical protein [Bacillus cereus]
MADAPLIALNDELPFGAEKINKGIQNANEALKRSYQTEISMNNAINVSNNASTTAKDAEKKATDVQTQLDSLVLEKGQSDAEVIQARGSHTVLNERLNDVDGSLADSALKLKYTANTLEPLGLITPYGDNQLTHPKVVYFPNGWNGFKYWMAYTPLPYYEEPKENPCIAVSNDMINWTLPTGLDSGLLDTPQNNDYNSDTHLVYRPDLNTLEIWYRGVHEGNKTEIIYKRTTTDGVNWTPREVMAGTNNGKILNFLSPAIIWDDTRKTYQIWVIDHYAVKYYETPSGKNWQYIKTLTVYYGETTAGWHIDVEKTDLGYEMLICTKGQAAGVRDSLFHVVFADMNQNAANATKIIRPNIQGSWDDTAIYRSCFLKINGIYYVFYAGQNSRKMYGVGLTVGTKSNDIKTLMGTTPAYDTKRVKEIVFSPDDKTAPRMRGNEGSVEIFNSDQWQKVALQSDIELGYGIRHTISSGKITRIGSAVGKVSRTYPSASDFDKLMPWAGMKRCNVPDDCVIPIGNTTKYKVNAYYGDIAYRTDGSNGQVMVEVPAFYFKRVFIDLDTIETYISPLPLPGYSMHPWFYDANGNPVTKKYIGAYEASLYDVSAGAYVLNDEQVGDFTTGTGDKLCSRSDVKPASGLTQQLTLPNSRILATNRGTGWQQQYFNAVSAIQMLAMVEYAALNLQAVIGGGVSYITDDGATNMAIKTGYTNVLGNTTGKVSFVHYGTGQTDYVIAYRGVESFWGNLWKWVDGINVKDARAYVSFLNTNFQSNVFNGQYINSGFNLPSANGYISKVGLNNYFDYGFLPIEASGSSTTHFADYFYQAGSGQYVAKMGGSWSDGSNSGPFALSVGDGSASKSRKFGARLAI